MCDEVDEAIDDGAEFIVLSDRDSTAELAPVPSLLMLAAVHHHLIRTEKRMQVGLIVEAGDVREVHHVALSRSATARRRSTRTSRWRRSRSSSAAA